MPSKSAPYQIIPYPRVRLPMVDGGRMGRRKHTVHGLFEVDVTLARRALREHKVRTGEALSFTAFVLACLGRAVDAHRHMHAYRSWRNQLVMFDEVDVNTHDGARPWPTMMTTLAPPHDEFIVVP